MGWHVASASSSVILRHALRLVRSMRRVRCWHLMGVMLVRLRLVHAHCWSVALLHVHLLPRNASCVGHWRPCLPCSTRLHCTMHLRCTASRHHMW